MHLGSALKQAGGAQGALDRFRLLSAEIEPADAECAEIGKGLGAFLQVEDLQRGELHPVERRAEVLLPNGDQPSGIRIRQRVAHQAVHQAEERSGGGEADRERRDGDNGRSAVPPQGASGEPEIFPELLQPDPAALVAGLFLDAVEVAELPPGGAVGLLRRHSGGAVRGRLKLEVRLQLRGHRGFELAAAKQRPQAGEKATNGTHGTDTDLAFGTCRLVFGVFLAAAILPATPPRD